MTDRNIIFEQGKRLSECYLWKMERDYFEKQGITAWLHDVPFYVTSNPFIANTYSSVVMAYIRDWIKLHPESKNHPFYVMELGTGPGRFSFYMVKELEEMRQTLGMHDVKIVYIMSDFAQANLDYHQSHHALIPLVEKGLLDFAVQDMDKTTPIRLVNSKVELNPETLVNPITLFTNYVFDTIPNDAFSVHNGKLYELVVTLSTPESNLKDNKPIELEKVQVDYSPKEIHGSYYKDPALDAVLELYRTSLKDTSFLVPIGSIRGLNHLRKLANNNMLLISSDKAYSEMATLDHLGHPSLTIHGGCFSMMVNCHAIGEYFKNVGGDFYPQSTRRGLKTCIYLTGATLKQLPETSYAVKEKVEGYSPTDYFNVYRHFNETAENCELENIASYMEMTRGDPHAYMRISQALINKVSNESDPELIEFLAKTMRKIADNYYFMPKADCILFEVAVFFHAAKRFDEALKYYQQAEKFLGPQFSLFYNTALCLHHMDNNAEALKYFKRSQELDPNSNEAKNWVEHLEKTVVDHKYIPKGRDE